MNDMLAQEAICSVINNLFVFGFSNYSLTNGEGLRPNRSCLTALK